MSVLIKGGRVITAADDYVADIFVEDERISLIGRVARLRSRQGRSTPTGKYVLPGAVDPHTHLDMPFGGTTTIDDVESGQRAAARGGTTCHVDFCIQAPGTSFADALADWHSKAEGKQVIDMGYHIAVTDLKEGGSLEELASLPDQGSHVVQALHGLQGRADGRRRDALQDDGGRGRDEGARDGPRRERRRDRRARQEGARGGKDGAEVPRADAAAGDRGRGDEPGDPARPRRRLRALRRPRLLRGVGRADQARPREGLGRLGRDVHAVLLRRLHVPRAARLRGRQVRLHAAAAGQGEPGSALGRGAARHAQRDLDRPLRLPLGRPEDARPRRLLEDPERRARASRTGCT